MSADPCPFCEIVADRAPAVFKRRWTDTIAIVPLEPVTDGHLLVIPHEHVSDVRDNEYLAGRTMQRAASLVSGWTQDVNIVGSAGPAASMTVPHLHLHVVPRRHGDGLHLPWTGQGARP